MATDTSFGTVRFFHDFNNPAVDETNDIDAGTENSGTQAINAQENGVYRLTTGTTDGNRVAWGTALNYQADNGGPLIVEFRVASVTAITTRAYFVGFTDTVPSGTLENPIEQSGTKIESDVLHDGEVQRRQALRFTGNRRCGRLCTTTTGEESTFASTRS